MILPDRIRLFNPNFVEHPGGVLFIVGELEKVGSVIEHGVIADFMSADIRFPNPGDLFDFYRAPFPAKFYRLHPPRLKDRDDIYGLFNILVHNNNPQSTQLIFCKDTAPRQAVVNML